MQLLCMPSARSACRRIDGPAPKLALRLGGHLAPGLGNRPADIGSPRPRVCSGQLCPRNEALSGRWQLFQLRDALLEPRQGLESGAEPRA
eukprot:1489338-Lingulodinium_polyedra.AAC.1